jgi:hypothetical protein
MKKQKKRHPKIIMFLGLLSLIITYPILFCVIFELGENYELF